MYLYDMECGLGRVLLGIAGGTLVPLSFGTDWDTIIWSLARPIQPCRSPCEVTAHDLCSSNWRPLFSISRNLSFLLTIITPSATVFQSKESTLQRNRSPPNSKMSRWHRPDCPAPAIVPAADGTPSCRACARTPDLDALIRQQAHASPFPAPPADQPRGQMNLWWPRSVPYVDVTAGGLDKDPSQQGSAPPPPEHPPPLPSQSTPAESTTTPAKNEQRSPIYPRPLAQGEFRLACLTPPTPVTSDADSASESDAASNPVHLTLETYPLTNCPAYETVSYCWAGEDADSMRRWPVYVGPWWDVMLHTRNCWELLRFVRPARGFRLMWVDAVCIDQSW